MKDSKALVESVKAAANSPQGSPTKSAKKLDAIQVDTSVGGAKNAAKSPKSPAVDQTKLQSPAVNTSSATSPSAAKSPKKLDAPANTSSPKKQQPSPKTPVK